GVRLVNELSVVDRRELVFRRKFMVQAQSSEIAYDMAAPVLEEVHQPTRGWVDRRIHTRHREVVLDKRLRGGVQQPRRNSDEAPARIIGLWGGHAGSGIGGDLGRRKGDH